MSVEAIPEKRFIREYVAELHNKNAGVFVGAGLSMPAGYVSWKELLKDAFTDLDLNPDAEYDLVTIAQYYCNQVGGNKNALTQKIFSAFKQLKAPQPNHLLLASLPIQVYWTTNYDKLIETALRQVNKTPDVKYNTDHLDQTEPDRDVTVYKMHGDVDHAAKAVISKDDYEKYPVKLLQFVQALRGDLIERTFLFLGFSFTDPNIDYILSRVRAHRDENTGRHHYCILKKVSKADGESDEDLRYKQLKQDYFIRDLKRYNILCVLVDEYADITRLLQKVKDSYRRSSVFVSGSAHEYGAIPENDAKQFIHALSYRIAEKQNRIITGFGLGVGDAVINGTLEFLEKRGKTVSDEDIMMRPFPQFPTGTTGLTEKWTAYRKAIAENGGIAVFLFVRKLVSGALKLVNSMDEEFALCHAARNKLIAVRETGYIAEEFHKRILAE
ncbi:MAG TPA: SIR2 family protein [Flavobacteriales bacterium]|nr:SIR2 family protein [Flavobacteriales bacterium]